MFGKNEQFSTAERSERVENFIFRATREYTEAGIEQATVAMRCFGANSPEPRRRAVHKWHVSAQKTSSYITARLWLPRSHRGSLSKRRELVLSWPSSITFFEGLSFLGQLTINLHLPNWSVCAGVVGVALSAKTTTEDQALSLREVG